MKEYLPQIKIYYLIFSHLTKPTVNFIKGCKRYKSFIPYDSFFFYKDYDDKDYDDKDYDDNSYV